MNYFKAISLYLGIAVVSGWVTHQLILTKASDTSDSTPAENSTESAAAKLLEECHAQSMKRTGHDWAKNAAGVGESVPMRRTNPKDFPVSTQARIMTAHGVGAPEILEKLEASNLRAAASDRVRFLRDVFRGAADRNPILAAEIIAALPEAERGKAALEVLDGSQDPREVFAVFHTITHDSKSGPLQNRFNIWIKMSKTALAFYGHDYSDWVMNLPPGVNRDMALSGLASEVEKDDPAQATALRAAKTPSTPAKPSP